MEIWTMLIEKAYAKIFGNYEIIEEGFCSEALNILTGAICEDIETEDENFIFKIKECFSKEYVITAACYSSEIKDEDFLKVGLVAKHAYSVLDIQQIKGQIIFQLRNPWGKESLEWNGKWGDSYQGWDIDANCHIKNNDGLFFIDY